MIHPVAATFGIVAFTVLLWSFRYEATRMLAAAILFAQWGTSLGSQLILKSDTPIEIYWAADSISAIVFLMLFLKFREWWLYAIAVLFIGMVFGHWLYLQGLHAYYHYLISTGLFTVQIGIVMGRLWRDKQLIRAGRLGKPDMAGRLGHKDSHS